MSVSDLTISLASPILASSSGLSITSAIASVTSFTSSSLKPLDVIAGVPVILLAGTAKADPQELKDLGIIKCFEAGPLDFSQPADEIKKTAFANMQRAAWELNEYLQQ